MTPVSSVADPSAVMASTTACPGAMAAMVGARMTIIAASKAVVLLSGPAIAERKPLLKATMVAVTAAVIKAAATPCERYGCNGPVKMKAP